MNEAPRAIGVEQQGNVPDLRHGRFEDAYALAVGCVLIAVGLAMLHAARLVTGGTAGIALLISSLMPVSPGPLFALLNLPFFWLAARMMGGWFTVRTIAVSIGIAGLTLLVETTTRIASGNPAVAAIAAGNLIGMGTLAVARHGAGVGGVGVVTLWLQKTRRWNAGRTQIAIDLTILAVSAAFLPLDRILWSGVSVVAVGTVVFLWHRPGRYAGFS
ncbi:YitT family protein [Sphingomonas carotinifaciens]|uniref:Uncharacterized 5xTM membrane BCR, YitT family COG1284 n=2 Tax=Sphingomonas carotinifaciens TaxID=1166323 RepID=A0A1G7PN34_9SPHN|nr:YitT family protein [Sphingomonas carotinifaciens]MBB4087613.1 uncharacterized membrane-anchored protein YitT (DUF2179 family) [Sphingomonas carotinifaciens]SDF87604.1 Uncharacterised 5xTM membrane BCR, YitT family COG1284 [Sphingomonas carotinifaciens]